MSRPLPNPVFHQEDPSNDTYSSATGAEDVLDQVHTLVRTDRMSYSVRKRNGSVFQISQVTLVNKYLSEYPK